MVSSGTGLKIRWRFTRTGLVVLAVAVAAGVAVIVAWPHAWLWVVVTGGVAAGAPALLSGLASVQQRRAETAKTVRRVLQGTTGAAGDILPPAAEAQLNARVHRAVLPIPYVRRDAEDEAQRHLESGRPVLLVGSSMVGKTRMAITLISGMFAGRRVAVPDSKDALAALDAADVALRDSVIFLDDIDRLIGAGGITDGSLRRLSAAGNTIVGTIRTAEYDRFQPTSELRRPEWDVLSVFERVFVNRTLSEAEELRLTSAVSDRQVREQIVQMGLGEYVGAAEHIEEALKLGPSVSPVGYALVLGVADWQRAGMSAPVPAPVLPMLATPHLAARDRVDLSDQRAYEKALQWARRRSTRRLLFSRTMGQAASPFTTTPSTCCLGRTCLYRRLPGQY